MGSRISVILAVYNGERYLREAIESILGQSYADFEFIIVDDASSDDTAGILDRFQDRRIIRLKNERNLGLAASLNRGLETAGGDYVARMDADDVALPARLEKQVDCLDRSPDIGIVGTRAVLIGPSGERLGLKPQPPVDTLIRWASLLRNPFMHSTVMMRRRLLQEQGLCYDERLQAAQDYDLFSRVLAAGRGSNLMEPLLRYRVHTGGISANRREAQLENHITIACRNLAKHLPEISVTPGQVRSLLGLLGLLGEEPDAPRPHGAGTAALVHLYLDMLERFCSKHDGAPNIGFLRRREAFNAARRVLRRPFQKGCPGLLKRLLGLHPGLPWELLAVLPQAVRQRFKKTVTRTEC